MDLNLDDEKILYAFFDNRIWNKRITYFYTDKSKYYYGDIIENDCDKYDDIECEKGYIKDDNDIILKHLNEIKYYNLEKHTLLLNNGELIYMPR